MKPLSFRPLANYVVIKRKAPFLGENLIVVPEAIKAKLLADSMRGTVLAIGPGHRVDCPTCAEKRSPAPCVTCLNEREVTIPVEGFSVGDEVIFLKASGDDEEIAGQTLFFIRSWSIVAVINKVTGEATPLQDRLFVKRREAVRKTRWGLIIPDAAVEEPTDGVVVAVGPGLRLGDGRLHPNELRVGDRVAFKRYEAVIESGKEKYVLLSEGPFGGGNVLALLPPDASIQVGKDVIASAKREEWVK